MGIDIKHNLDELLIEIEGLEARTRDVSPVTKVMASRMRAMIVDGFSKEQDPFGDPWKPLSQTTKDLRDLGGVSKRSFGKLRASKKKRRRKNSRSKSNHKILSDTGGLQGSSNASGEKNTIVFGSNVEYGAAHLFGRGRINFRTKSGVGGSAEIPRRAYLPVDEGGKPNFDKGPAKRWFDQLRDRLTSYITQGKL